MKSEGVDNRKLKIMRQDWRQIIQKRLFLTIGLWSIVHGLWSFSIFAQNLEEDIRDIRPPVSYPASRVLWLLILVVIAVSLLIFFFKKKKTLMHGVVDFPKPAWEIALGELELLKQKKYPDQGLVKPFYIELSLILRHYIENRFLINAPEMTTEEFLESLKFTDSLNESQKSRLQDFLVSCDMVKFAKYSASGDEMENSFELVEKFVEETIIRASEHMST